MSTPKFKLGQKVLHAHRVPSGFYADYNGDQQRRFAFEEYLGQEFWIAGVSLPSEGSGHGIKYTMSWDEYGIRTFSWMPEECLEEVLGDSITKMRSALEQIAAWDDTQVMWTDRGIAARDIAKRALFIPEED